MYRIRASFLSLSLPLLSPFSPGAGPTAPKQQDSSSWRPPLGVCSLSKKERFSSKLSLFPVVILEYCLVCLIVCVDSLVFVLLYLCVVVRVDLLVLVLLYLCVVVRVDPLVFVLLYLCVVVRVDSVVFVLLYRQLLCGRRKKMLPSTPRALGGNWGRHIYMGLLHMYLLISFMCSSLVDHTCNGYGRRPFTLVVLFWSLGRSSPLRVIE